MSYYCPCCFRARYAETRQISRLFLPNLHHILGANAEMDEKLLLLSA